MINILSASMAFGKSHILNEIRRTAAQNGGVPLGMDRFFKEVGIAIHDWHGVHWAKWNDAVREAGFEPNRVQGAIDREHLIAKVAECAIELGRLPTDADLRLKKRRDPSFPATKTIRNLGFYKDRIAAVAEYCRAREEFNQVLEWCIERSHTDSPTPADGVEVKIVLGYVYLLKHGSRREYKIGRTNNPIRREGEIAIELPERVKPVHVIQTDDPAGIETYWHNRFSQKRKNGEWFELNALDVSAFKRRKFM